MQNVAIVVRSKGDEVIPLVVVTKQHETALFHSQRQIVVCSFYLCRGLIL